MTSLAGIPGTLSPDAARLRWLRMEDHGGCRRYRAETPDGFLVAMVGQEPCGLNGRPIWHLSVSHRDKNTQPDRVPNWDELKHAAYRLIPADVPLVLIFPRRSTPADRYVNLAENCLHVWESEDALIDGGPA